MPLFKTCRSCSTPSVDASYRDDAFVVMCAACHADFTAGSQDQGEAPVETRVVFPEETGVLTYNPFRMAGRQQS